MAIRHIKSLVFLIGEGSRMPPLSHRNFLFPADGIEAPILQILGYRFFQPFSRLAFIFLPPHLDIFRITHTGRIDMVEAYGKEGLAFGSLEPPTIFTIFEGEEVAAWFLIVEFF